MSELHHLRVGRSARYFTLGEPSDNTTQVWIVCHGYRQLAERFISYFSVLDRADRYIVSPEALSRFYVEDRGGEHGQNDKIGASWMTREDRLNEIEDYVTYLDTLCETVLKNVDRDKIRVVAFGFSQGVATVCRWVEQGHSKIDHLIMWGGLLPRDVDAKALHKVDVTLVKGKQDELINESGFESTVKVLAKSGVNHSVVRFDGGHHLNQRTLRAVAEAMPGRS